MTDQRKATEALASTAYAKAVTCLVRGKVNFGVSDGPTTAFFTALAMRLEPVVDWDIPMAAADGERLYYNPDYLLELPTYQAVSLICEEVMHCAHQHFARRKGRDKLKWEVSADLAVMSILQDAGFDLPDEVCMPGEGVFADLETDQAAESYYSQLGDGLDAMVADGTVVLRSDIRDAPAGSVKEMSATWKAAIAQAAHHATKGRGTLPAGLERFVRSVVEPSIDWRDELSVFVTSHAKNDHVFGPYNRRHVQQGAHLPSLRSNELGNIVLLIDTSGSITQRELDRFASEIQAIADVAHAEVTIAYHDTEVAGVQHWTKSDGPLKLEPKGGGGTSHVKPFQWIDVNLPDPTCVVAFTDLMSDFPDEPDYPVLWLTTTQGAKGPWGRTIHVPIKETL